MESDPDRPAFCQGRGGTFPGAGLSEGCEAQRGIVPPALTEEK